MTEVGGVDVGHRNREKERERERERESIKSMKRERHIQRDTAYVKGKPFESDQDSGTHTDTQTHVYTHQCVWPLLGNVGPCHTSSGLLPFT